MSNPAEGDMEDIRSAKSTGIGSPEAMGDKDGDTFPTEEPGVFTELVESTDFPNFVADLIKAVFDANLKVMKEQTDAYIQLMKEATESMVDFIKKVNEEAAFLKLAESKGDKYGITIEQTADSCQKLVLTTVLATLSIRRLLLRDWSRFHHGLGIFWPQ